MLTEQSDQLSPRSFIITTVVIGIAWVVASWFIAHSYTNWQTEQAYHATEQKARASVGELYESMQRAFQFLHLIPNVVSHDENIQAALAGYNKKSLSNLSDEERRQYSHQQPALAEINSELANIVNNIDIISVLWLMRNDGISIASSNADTPDSFAGISYADRDYFRVAMDGQIGREYAVGRHSNIPGLILSAPVRVKDKVLGVMAAKIDLSYTYNWISQAHGYLIDQYGVIIQATDPEEELMALPEAEVHKLSDERRMARYMQTEFKTLELKPWETSVDTPLYTIGKNTLPYYVLTTSLFDGSMKLMVTIESTEIEQKGKNRQILFLTLISGGILLLILVAALTYHFQALQLARKIRARQELVEHLASHDSLTGLYSRSLTDQLINQYISIAIRNRTKFAIMFIDLDLFKDINDSFGHEIGDEILRELAERIEMTVSKTDAVIRHGGDEFIILINDIQDREEAATIAMNLQDVIQKELVIQDTSMTMSASIGIAIYPNDGETPSLLVRHADTALYNVKEKGRADYSFYQSQMSVDLAARKALEADMIRGLENNEFFLVYQPQYSTISKGITGCEALVRWRHPSNRIVSPLEFVPAAERSGFIGILGEWVLNEACRQANEWRKEFKQEISIAVNLSTVQFQRSDLLNIVRRVIREHQVSPGLLELEVTESVLMSDTERTYSIMQEMKALGIHMSIDDFGTGYSSLAYLKKFDADVLKIDRTFVNDMENNTNDQAIISAIINMAKSLDYHVIAEGVETRGQYEMLVNLGCTAIQGYWLSLPLTASEFSRFYTEKLTATGEWILN